MNTSRCVGCGVVLAESNGVTHRYMRSSPACWEMYGELLAREYQHPDRMGVHRLTVDTYAVQHPGTRNSQSVQSVAIHLIALHAVLELGTSQKEATSLLKVGADKRQFYWLDPPVAEYRINVLHPYRAKSAAGHIARVQDWAISTWEAWARHHEQIRTWAASLRTSQ